MRNPQMPAECASIQSPNAFALASLSELTVHAAAIARTARKASHAARTAILCQGVSRVHSSFLAALDCELPEVRSIYPCTRCQMAIGRTVHASEASRRPMCASVPTGGADAALLAPLMVVARNPSLPLTGFDDSWDALRPAGPSSSASPRRNHYSVLASASCIHLPQGIVVTRDMTARQISSTRSATNRLPRVRFLVYRALQT
jgi:hypothetical protein